MRSEHSPSSSINKDLAYERSQATFNVNKMTHLLDGGPEKTARRRYLESLIERDPTGVFNNEDNRYLHRSERHVRALAKHVRLIEICRSIGIGSEPGAAYPGEIVLSPDFYTLVASVADELPTALHWIMFLPNILSLCDEEQKKQWLPLCRDWKVIGCYAQTELGHGSNVRALETTATFLTEEKGGMKGGSWIIHCPTLTSTKFWPGTLGRVANHAMVIARLIDGQGTDRGIHNFLVQIRSMTDHTLMPGIECGDIGPKIGYNNMDNGYARFTHVRIPRRNMAMRFATVDERGNYSLKNTSDAASKVAYITMMQVRAHIVNEAGKNLAVACTIAIRYSAVRRQGFVDEDQDQNQGMREIQILDYKQQQYRLLPLLAASYCFFFTGRHVLSKLRSIEQRLVSGTGVVTKTEVGDIHASTSALKSFCTTVAADGMEDCRKSCGGHGFLQSSGLPELVCSYLQSPTVEGDNQMLPQQVFKVLFKLYHAIVKGETQAILDWEVCDAAYLIEPIKYFVFTDKRMKCPANSMQDFMNISILLEAYRHRSARLLVETVRDIEYLIQQGSSTKSAWNSSLIRMAKISQAHSLYLLIKNFSDGIVQEKSRFIGLEEALALQDLKLLFSLVWIDKDIGDFLEDGYMNSAQCRNLRQAILKVLDRVRQNAVALVDARDFSDFRLKSTLGRYDGDVYPSIMETAMKEPLNGSEPGRGYDHLKRLIVDGVGIYSGSISSKL